MYAIILNMGDKMETFWPEVRKLENQLVHNDPKYLKEFIDLLKENEQLIGHMYHALCECTLSRKECSFRWDLLHKFAKSKSIEISTEGGK